MSATEHSTARDALPVPSPGAVAAMAVAALVLALPALAGWSGRSMTGWLLAATLALGSVLSVLSAIDLASRRLPDVLTLPLVGAGLTVVWLADPGLLPWHLAGAAVGFLALWGLARLYLLHRGHPGLGRGDAKLAAAAGAWLGLEGLPSLLLIASFAALSAVAAAWLAGRKITLMTAVPFGPFLALGLWMVWLYGPIS